MLKDSTHFIDRKITTNIKKKTTKQANKNNNNTKLTCWSVKGVSKGIRLTVGSHKDWTIDWQKKHK